MTHGEVGLQNMVTMRFDGNRTVGLGLGGNGVWLTTLTSENNPVSLTPLEARCVAGVLTALAGVAQGDRS
jgi:hypothetical protein